MLTNNVVSTNKGSKCDFKLCKTYKENLQQNINKTVVE